MEVFRKSSTFKNVESLQLKGESLSVSKRLIEKYGNEGFILLFRKLDCIPGYERDWDFYDLDIQYNEYVEINESLKPFFRKDVFKTAKHLFAMSAAVYEQLLLLEERSENSYYFSGSNGVRATYVKRTIEYEKSIFDSFKVKFYKNLDGMKNSYYESYDEEKARLGCEKYLNRVLTSGQKEIFLYIKENYDGYLSDDETGLFLAGIRNFYENIGFFIDILKNTPPI